VGVELGLELEPPHAPSSSAPLSPSPLCKNRRRAIEFMGRSLHPLLRALNRRCQEARVGRHLYDNT
jgi:hypothetical protein